MQTTTQAAVATTGAVPLVEAGQPGRLLSLDVFRGLTVAAMLLVNNPGDWGHIYPPLEHAPWNGCTPTDLIFPFFLFIVGVSIAYALGPARQDPARHPALLGASSGGRPFCSGWACCWPWSPASTSPRCASWACCSASRWCFWCAG